MIYTEDRTKDKPLFVIEEKPDVIPGQPDGETPVITIETDVEGASDMLPSTKNRRRLPWVAATAFVTVLICLCAVAGYMYYRIYINIGVPVSVTSEQNIAKLQRKHSGDVRAEVVMTSDSILGVGMNFYELRGLKAEISFVQPDTTDMEVYLYSRCSDFTSYDRTENHYLGTLVVNGEE